MRNQVTLTVMEGKPLRSCGDCTLCCRLLPIQRGAYPRERIVEVVTAMCKAGLARPQDFVGMLPDFDKPAGGHCPHQSHHRGCKVYAKRPFGCRVWSCRWLVNDDTGDLRRPDRSRYVIDMMPDFIRLTQDGATTNVEIVQVWIDPKHPNAWREDEALLAYLDRRGREGKAALIRSNAKDAIVLFPPSMSSDGQWHERSGRGGEEHRDAELFEGLADAKKVFLEVK